MTVQEKLSQPRFKLFFNFPYQNISNRVKFFIIILSETSKYSELLRGYCERLFHHNKVRKLQHPSLYLSLFGSDKQYEFKH